MSTLTLKHRVAVNAALATIHASGGDATVVSRAARNYMASGHDPRKSYELALNGFAATSPEIAPTLARVTRLVQASDVATLARYDSALNQYSATGDESGLNALQPMIEADSDALDARDDAPETPAADPTTAPVAAPVQDKPANLCNGTQVGPFAGRGYSAPKTGVALARQIGVPMSFNGPAVAIAPSA